MKIAEPIERTEVGVIVARFQGHELHEAHIDLLDTVSSRHKRVFLFLGCTTRVGDSEDPLDYKNRAAMIRESYPDIEIADMWDERENDDWSRTLDSLIRKWLPPGQKATLYGSRDSFIPYYSGKFPTIALEPEINISATMIRKDIRTNYPSSKDFRAGMINATALRYPIAFQTVDVAIFDENGRILLVQKPKEKKWRFPGGFSDVEDDSLEQGAKREASEETGVEIDNITYVGSRKIDDWRYRKSKNKIKTALFAAKYIFGRAEGADDVAFAKWFDIDKLTKDDIMPEHHVLYDLLVEKEYIILD